MRRLASGLLGVVLVLGAGTARPVPLSDNTVRLLPSKFRLLQNIGPLRYTGSNRYTDRRLGRSFGYGASGISLTIYVYDFGMRGLPDGPDSVAACEQFERAKREIETGGNYQNVVLRREVTRRMRDTADAPLAREAVYEFDRNGIHATSLLWVTVADGYFVKLRLSLRSEVADEVDDARMQILATMAEAIAARPRRPAKPDSSPETSVDFDAGQDPADAALWFAYAGELLRASRDIPGAMPPCGGMLIPGYAAELAARRAALREYHMRDAQADSAYFSELARIDAAGFLEEYVWYYLRSEVLDKEPPGELDLAGFESFRLRELAAHEAKTGARVRVNTVRALPLDPQP
jgi:hypothetical protein